MTVVYWIAGGLLAGLGGLSALFFLLFLTSGESGPRKRALALFHWFKLLLLLTVNYAIWSRVALGVINLIRS